MRRRIRSSVSPFTLHFALWRADVVIGPYASALQQKPRPLGRGFCLFAYLFNVCAHAGELFDDALIAALNEVDIFHIGRTLGS